MNPHGKNSKTKGGTTIELKNGHVAIRLEDDGRSGLTSLQDAGTAKEFVQSSDAPLYKLELTRDGRAWRTVTSKEAGDVDAELSRRPEGQTLTMCFRGHDGLELTATCRIELDDDSNLSKWRISIENGTEYGVRVIHFPVLLAPPALRDDGDDFYVSGGGCGRMIWNPGKVLREEEPARKEEDNGEQVLSMGFCTDDYPGPVGLQMQAYYDDTAGLYMATYDSEGCTKRLGCRPAEAGDALDLTIQHRYDEQPGLDFALPYDIVVGTFTGDWYDAADIYKEWAYQQHWCSKKLLERDDIPDWFKEPRPHLMVISRGGVDRAQATLPCPPSEFPLDKTWPAKKAAAFLKKFAAYFDVPLVAWVEGWEKIGSPGGPVDIFPPYEGEESFIAAMDELARDGHINCLYLAALHWCYRRASTGYYAEEKFEREGRPLAALNEEGDVDRYVFASAQKHFVNLCVGCEGVQDLFEKNFMKLMDLGGVWLQLDQQVGLYTAPCYSNEHGHPPGYGRWMYQRMLEFVRRIRRAAKARTEQAAFSCENACEIWIQETDSFMTRPYLSGDKMRAIPMFVYVYHPYAISYGGDMAMWLMHVDAACIKHAYCCAYGLQNLVSVGEPDYDIEVEGAEHPVLPLLKSIFTAQRTYARDYLVFGRMRRPAAIEVPAIPIELWWPPTYREIRMIFKDIPAVVHSTWQAEDGRIGTVLVNWTGDERAAGLTLAQPGKPAFEVTEQGRRGLTADAEGVVRLNVPPRSVMLVEQP